MKKSILLALVTMCLAFASCGKSSNWISELESKNPLRNDTNHISVYFKFDTIINNFEVSGIFYPRYDDPDTFNGWYMRSAQGCSSVM